MTQYIVCSSLLSSLILQCLINAAVSKLDVILKEESRMVTSDEVGRDNKLQTDVVQ